MDQNGTFWYGIWRLIAGTIVSIVLTIGGCTYASNQQVVEMVKAGADPIAASCALSSSSHEICPYASARKAAP